MSDSSAGTPTPDLELLMRELTTLRDEIARLRAQRQAALDLCDTMIASLDPRDVNIVVVIRKTLGATE